MSQNFSNQYEEIVEIYRQEENDPIRRTKSNVALDSFYHNAPITKLNRELVDWLCWFFRKKITEITKLNTKLFASTSVCIAI